MRSLHAHGRARAAAPHSSIRGSTLVGEGGERCDALAITLLHPLRIKSRGHSMVTPPRSSDASVALALQIVGIGKAGNPDVMDGVTPGMLTGVTTEALAGEKMIVTAGGLDTHVHYICPQVSGPAHATRRRGRPCARKTRTGFFDEPGVLLKQHAACPPSRRLWTKRSRLG